MAHNCSLKQKLVSAIRSAGWRECPPADPTSSDEYLAMLRVLYEVGRVDLPLARLLEGHVDAVQIVQRLGNERQSASLREKVADGKILGVWNAALTGTPLVLYGNQLQGAKSFASGAGILDFALVTAERTEGSDISAQLVLMDLIAAPPRIDQTWWNVTGMQRSQTHQVQWDKTKIQADALLGKPGSYADEPWFSGGALRFVAVQAGAVAGIFDQTQHHLEATGRLDDPFQKVRLGELFNLADSAAGKVSRTARRWFEETDQARLTRVAAARTHVLAVALEAMTLARAAVGVKSMFNVHPLAALLTDLDVYLRQPAPDAARLLAGSAAGSGLLLPGL